MRSTTKPEGITTDAADFPLVPVAGGESSAIGNRPAARAEADVPDPRRPREEDVRIRAFVDAMSKLAADAELCEELAAACGHVKMPNDNGQVSFWARWDAEGVKAAGAVRGVLLRRRLPLELTDWAVTLGVCGTVNPAAAYEYFGAHVAPVGTIETEPFTGQRQIVVRVPADWSAKRSNDWLRRTIAQLRRASIHGVPLVATSPGGPPLKLTRTDALALVRKFDQWQRQRWANATPPRVDGMGHDDWIEAFQTWLENVGEKHSAEHLLRTHVRPAIVSGELKLRTLDIALRASKRPPKTRPRR